MSRKKEKTILAVILFAVCFCLSGVSEAAADSYYTEGFFLYSINGDSVSIHSYYGAESEVVIPDHIASLPVTEIEAGAFSGRSSITQITIPDTVAKVAEDAFADMSNLKKIVNQSEAADIKAPENVVVQMDYPVYLDPDSLTLYTQTTTEDSKDQQSDASNNTDAGTDVKTGADTKTNADTDTARDAGSAPGYEIAAEEFDSNEAEAKESQSDEAKTKEAKSDKADSKEAEADEAEAQESNSDEAKIQETESDEAKTQETESDEAKTQETEADKATIQEAEADAAKTQDAEPDDAKDDSRIMDAADSAENRSGGRVIAIVAAIAAIAAAVVVLFKKEFK